MLINIRSFSRQLLLFCPLMLLATAALAEPYRITIILPLSGSASLVGEQQRIGAELAWEAYRDQLAVRSIELFFDFEDDQGQPAQTVEVFRRMKDNNRSGVYLAALSSTSMMLKTLVEKENDLLVTTAAHPELTKNSNNVIRNFFTVSVARETLFEYMRSKGLRKLALLYSEDELGQGAYEDIQRTNAELGIQLVSAASFNRQSTDFKSILLKIKAKKPDLVYLVGIGPAMGLALRQAKEMALGIQSVGWVFCNQSVVMNEGPEITEGVLSLDPQIAKNSEKYRKFEELFRKRYPDKKIEIGTIFQFDTSSAVIEAILSGARKSSEVRDWIIAQKSFDFAAGSASFNSSGDADHKMQVNVINSGKCRLR